MAILEALIDKRLDDDCEDRGRIRQAARQYYLDLIHEDLRLSEGVDLNECLDSNEGMVLGFLKGYRAALNVQAS